MRFFGPQTLILVLASSALAFPSKLSSKESTIEITALNADVSEVSEGGGSSSSSSSSSSLPNNTTPCSPAVMALASGIQENIVDQNNELNTVTAMGSILSQNPVDGTLFGATQASLMGFVTKGIAIRQNNQKIAPAGNPAIAGLAIVATAQMTELNLTMSLGVGGVNVARDNATVNKLKGDFAGGITQNMKNLVAAMSNCTAPAGSEMSVSKL